MRDGLALVARILSKYSELIAGVLTIVAVILSFALGQVSRQANASNADVTTLREQNGALQEQLDRRGGTIRALNQTIEDQAQGLAAAKAQIDRLNALLSRPTPSPTSSVGPEVRNENSAVKLIGDGGEINLKSAHDPSWGFTPEATHGPGTLTYSPRNGGLYTAGISIAHLDRGPPTYSSCSIETAYGERNTYVDPSTLEGHDVCIRVDDNLFGTLRVTKLSRDAVVMHIKTWQSP